MAWRAYNTVNGQILGETSASGARPLDYQLDALGSVVGTIKTNGTLENTYRYAGYGQQVSKTGLSGDPKFQWVGGWGYRDSLQSHYVRTRHLIETYWTSISGHFPIELPWTYVVSPNTDIDPSGQDMILAQVIKNNQGTLCAYKPPEDPADFIIRKCNCQTGEPKIRKAHKGYSCFKEACSVACKIINRYNELYITDECPGWPNIIKCIEFNSQPNSRPCVKGDQYWEYCSCKWGTGIGGNLSNNPPHNQGILNNTCCVECQIRACCKVQRIRNGANGNFTNMWIDCELKYGKA